MKKTFLLFAACILTVACSSRINPENRVRSSGEENVLHALYQELKEQRPELGALEKEVQDIDRAKNESLQEYYQYDEKNQHGYSMAKERVGMIEDSLLRNSIELIINKSQYAYEQENAAMSLAAATLENRSQSLHDHQEALKIILTLNLLEKYQKKQLPNPASYEKIMNRYNSTIHKVDSLLLAK